MTAFVQIIEFTASHIDEIGALADVLHERSPTPGRAGILIPMSKR